MQKLMKNKDIAKQLGISPATFSLVINNKPGVSPETRETVINYIKKKGLSHLNKNIFPPNNNHNICFIVYKRHGEILDQAPFFLLLMESIENSSRQLGYGNTFFTLDKRNSLPEQINHLNSMNAEGAVIFATEMEKDDIPSLSSLKLPYVLLDNDFKTTAIDSVAIDNNLGTYQAIEHLFKKGHKKIGYLQSKVLINSFRERQSGYTEALKSFGLILEPRFHFHVDFSEEGSYHDFKEILNRNIDLPTAFVTDDDTIAAGTIKALCEKGLKVPGDISIIGFDDRPLCEKTSPRLSTIRVPRLSFGGHAINLIVKRIQNDPYLINKNYAIKMRIGTYLVERESVKNFN